MTDDIDAIIGNAKVWRGGSMAIATVLSTWGSAPRPRGSHMLVHKDGRFAGSVSGGCVEGEVLHAAADCIADRTIRRLRFGVDDDRAWEAGLPCGGEIEILLQPVGDDGFPAALFDTIAEVRAGGATAQISTDLATGLSFLGEAQKEGFVNVYPAPRRLLIVGAVHIAQPLARIAGELGIAVTVIDPRARFLTDERFPDVARDDRWPDEAVAAFKPDRSTAVVALSHDPKIDDPALATALNSAAVYIGALGSRKSHKARLDRLRFMGFDENALARIDGPAGLPIGSRSPAGIALSIAAAIEAAFSRETSAP